MSSIHYKFKATLEYKTLTFDGLHISVDELKRVICDKENIRTELFDLVLTNAHTKRQYGAGGAEELVPRNSSVVVQRLPRENSLKLPKIRFVVFSYILVLPLALVIGFCLLTYGLYDLIARETVPIIEYADILIICIRLQCSS